MFNQAKFEQYRQSKQIGQTLEWFAEIDSTNNYLRQRLMTADAPTHGHIVLTDYQSAGRGRMGRSWIAPAGSSLLVTIFLKPKFTVDHASWLTMIAGLAAIEAIEATTSLTTALKWPNDVMLQNENGQWCKTGGILLEAELDGDVWRYALIGMGLNVNISVADLPEAATPASSLLVASGKRVERELLLARWIDQLEFWLASAENNQSPQPAWNTHLITINQPVTVSGAIDVEGVAIGTDDYGHLIVQDQAAKKHTVAAGDVTLRPR